MNDITIFLGNKNYSSWSLRAWLALERSGASFREVMVDINQPAPRPGPNGVLPAGRVPALQVGDLVIWDSLAICEYLAETYPKAKLWPGDAAARARARSVCAEMHSGFQAMRNEMSMNIRKRFTGRKRSPECEADVARVKALWTECLRASGGPFLLGDFTIADAFYAPVVTRFRTYGIETDAPCSGYVDAVLAHSGMRAWCAAGESEPPIARYDE